MNESKAVKAGLGYTIGNYLLKGLSFLTVPIFARLLTTEDFGIYSAFVAYETILFIIQGAAIHTSYKNAKYKYDINQKKNNDVSNQSFASYISATMWLLIVNTIAFLLIGNIFCITLTKWLGLNRLSINLLILYSFSTATITCFNAEASLNYNYKRYLLISAINAIGNLLLSLIFILTIYSGQRYMGRIMGTVVPIFLISVYIVFRFHKKDSYSNIINYLKWGIGFSGPIIFHGLSQVILSQFDRIMIRNINGDAAAGLYSFGYTIFSIINVTFNSTDAVWSTWFYDKLNKGNTKDIKKYSSYYIFLVAIICSLLMIICPEVITILGSTKYSESKYSAIPIIASGFYVFLYTLPSGVEYYYERTKKIAFATIAAAAINVVLNLIFINRYGYIAAAYTTLFTYILYFLFHYYQAKRIAGYQLFSNSSCAISSLLIFASMVISLFLIDAPWIRWGIACVFSLTVVIYDAKRTKLIRTIVRQVIKRKR